MDRDANASKNVERRMLDKIQEMEDLPRAAVYLLSAGVVARGDANVGSGPSVVPKSSFDVAA
jgi:hypothetical protein